MNMPLPRKQAFDFLWNMPRYFWLLMIILTLTFGVFFTGHFRTYSSQVTILIVQKNEKTSASADQVVRTIAEFPKTLSFYNSLLKQFPEVKDPWIGMGDNERKNLWAQRVSVERVDESGLIRLQVNADTASDASLLAEKSATVLFSMIGRYYNIRTELDIRTIDPSITHAEIHSPFGWLLTSVSASFVVSSILSSMILVVSKRVRNIRRTLFISQSQSTNVPLTPVVFDNTPQETTPLYRNFAPQFPNQFLTPIQTPPAPTSTQTHQLPFLEEGVSLEDHLFGVQNSATAHPLEQVMQPIDAHSEQEQETTKEMMPTVEAQSEIVSTPSVIATEPTQEELKRRLNQLLKGDM